MKTYRATLALVGLSLVLCTGSATAKDKETGFKQIFDGKTLTGWDGNPKLWSVRDGAITGQTTKENPTKGNTFIIWKAGTVKNFELRLSYRIVGGNSGIQYRSKEIGKWRIGGYQGDFEAGKTYSGILYDEGGVAGGRGIMATRGQKVVYDAAGKKKVVGSVGNSNEIQNAIKPKEYNEYVIIARGGHLVHKINGHVTVDVTDNSKSKRLTSGILALQLHAGPPMLVQFKNIRLKVLDE